jgi:hypothetical protein
LLLALIGENTVIGARGVGLLDQLLWCERIEPQDFEHLLVATEQHASEAVREQTVFIREYLRKRSEDADDPR